MPSDSAARMLAAREEVIERLRESAELHGLDDAQLVAVGVNAIAAAIATAEVRRRFNMWSPFMVRPFLALLPSKSMIHQRRR